MKRNYTIKRVFCQSPFAALAISLYLSERHFVDHTNITFFEQIDYETLNFAAREAQVKFSLPGDPCFLMPITQLFTILNTGTSPQIRQFLLQFMERKNYLDWMDFKFKERRDFLAYLNSVKPLSQCSNKEIAQRFISHNYDSATLLQNNERNILYSLLLYKTL